MTTILDKQPVKELERLVLKENHFETKGIIGQGHFGEVHAYYIYSNNTHRMGIHLGKFHV